jgi:hypothetical protein
VLRMFAKTRIAAIVLAGAAVAAAAIGVPAQAHAGPRIVPGMEGIHTYYNDAQHTTIVGQVEYGCWNDTWGTTSDYQTFELISC